MAERRFVHFKLEDKFFEVIGRQEDGEYLCAYKNTTAPLVVSRDWPLVGLTEATAGRLRGATIYTVNNDE
jgi:hypothetical protein